MQIPHMKCVVCCLGLTQVSVNGESIGRFTSQPGSTFTALGIEMNGVGTLEFEAVGLDSSEWIDISEVSD